jgi:serine/threonine-protein kinase
MDANAWTKLSRLLDEALDLPPEQRMRWIDGLGEEHAEVVARLRSLLGKATSAVRDGFLDTLPKVGAGTLGEGDVLVAGGLESGATVGPYQVLSVLGEGGMGAVWLAERTDGVLRRRVALKVPRGSWPRAGLRERIARERDILAALTHPNIARLYDAGSTASGQPYLALELVDGQPIDQHAADRHLDIPARLRLFLQCARAVAYAHRNLVVHRDLKPSNILVTTDGQVKLLDFGIAKLLEEGQARETLLTELSGRLLTPEFASPEQLAGAPLTVATDVYSLGVVLHHLLTGTGPYRPRNSSRAALEDAVRGDDRIPPSEAATEPGLRRPLRGDLDTIVLKALKRESDERYSTVDAFADDVERHLAGLPVLARPDSTWYRVSKFVRRHAVPVGVAAVALVCVLAGAAVAIWQARVATIQQRRAEQVKEFIGGIFRTANLDAENSRSMTVIDLLKKASERVATLQTSPEVRVELLNLLGASVLSLGDTDTLERVATQAVEEGGRSLPPDHELAIRSRLLMAWAHMYRGRPAEMRVEIDRAMAVMEKTPQRFAGDLATAWRLRASAALDSGQYAEAETAAREAASRSEAAYGTRAQETVNAWTLLADVARRNGKVDEALTLAERVLRVSLEIHPDAVHPEVMDAKAIYGRALADTGKLADGVEQLKQALGIGTKLFGPEGRSVGFHLQQLSGYQLRLGRIKDAIENADRSLRILSTHAQPGSFTQAAGMNSLAQALLAARRGSDALPLFDQVVEAAGRIFGPAHMNTLNARANHALALGYSGKLADANREIGRVVEDMRGAGASLPRPLYVAGVLAHLAAERERAIGLLEEARKAADAAPATRVDLGQAQAEIGSVLADLGSGDAEAPLNEALTVFKEIYPLLTPPHADALVALGRVRMSEGRAGEVLPLLEQADAFWREFDAGNRWAGEAALRLAQCYASLGRHAEARAAFARARAALEGSPYPADAAVTRLAAYRTVAASVP